MSAIPQAASRDEWLQALPQALVAGFVKTDIEFQHKGRFPSSVIADLSELSLIACSYLEVLGINDRRNFRDDGDICRH